MIKLDNLILITLLCNTLSVCSFAEAPKIALATGWECNISNIGYSTGPNTQLGLQWAKHYIGGSYQWCLMSNHNDLKPRDELYQFGGGGLYYFQLFSRKLLSFAIGTTAGYWHQVRKKYKNYYDQNDYYRYWLKYDYYYYGGPKCKVQIGTGLFYVTIQYTLFMGKVEGYENLYDHYSGTYIYDRDVNKFFVRNSVNYMIWIEL